MAILSRMLRMCKADFHGVMDQLEDRQLLVRQHLREMTTELDRKRGHLAQLLDLKKTTQQQYGACMEDIQALKQDIHLAIDNQRDEIARHFIRKLGPLEHLAKHLSRKQTEMDGQIDELKACIQRQTTELQRLQARANAFFIKHQPSGGCPSAAADTDPMTSDMSDEEVELMLMRMKQSRQPDQPHGSKEVTP